MFVQSVKFNSAANIREIVIIGIDLLKEISVRNIITKRSNPVEALIFFRLLSNLSNWKIYCDDHTSLSSHTAVQI